MTGFVACRGYKNYEIDILGNVRSVKSKKFLKACETNSGYLIVNLYNDNGIKSFGIHRLLGLNDLHVPEDTSRLVIDHIDRDKTNNSIENLRWLSYKENYRNSSRC